MKIFYTNAAIVDLKRLRDFIGSKNLLAASQAATRLQQAIQRLQEFPLLGKEVKIKTTSLSLRDLITGQYIVRYTILSDEIHVLRIWHGKEEDAYWGELATHADKEKSIGKKRSVDFLLGDE